MVGKIHARIFDKFPRLDFLIRLDFELKEIEKWMRFAIAGELNSAVLQQLLADDVAQRVVFSIHGDGGKIINLG